jgi:hypothetical protein
MSRPPTVEHERLERTRDRLADWKAWGPYLAERAWGTVREDYSADGNAWDYFPHDHARSRAYRWNEDGLAGICDRAQRLCLALALWNGKDPILKERLFGLTGNEGNHGEDAKEYYFYLDSTPTHSYMKMLYKYPQAAFPYALLVAENRRRDRHAFEYELLDTGVFDQARYFDVVVEYAKAAPDDVLMQVSATNRGPEAALLHLLPQLWFRNTWSWGATDATPKPELRMQDDRTIVAQHPTLGERWLCLERPAPTLFTENETNYARLFDGRNASPFTKDGIHRAVVDGATECVNPAGTGTKVAAHYAFTLQPNETVTLRLRLSDRLVAEPWADYDDVFAQRRHEADKFYGCIQPPRLSDDERNVQRQAFAGLLWCKQWYHYDVETWLNEHPLPARRHGRNHDWTHLNNQDILSMPDTWEYPWFAAWDLAFHCIPLALIDPDFAKRQLILMLREWYMHPNGQIPAYEWAFGDVNPPVHAWAAWRVYKIEQKQRGVGDTIFLERVFHKLLLNFTWWVNRKDLAGHNVFQGGFLGLDNIGVFDRSAELPGGAHLEQCDGTSWMGMFCLNMLAIALELARTDPAYEDVATKFFEHFMYIAYALNNIASDHIELWDTEDEFPYDVLHLDDDRVFRLKVRSMVGLIPLFAVETIEPDLLTTLPRFKRRMEWFLEHRPDLAALVSHWDVPGSGQRRLMALLRGHRMKRVLKRMLDPSEFLSPFGVRSLSKYHEAHPYTLRLDGAEYSVGYEPAESRTGLFGGNSNWRGPVWMPVNYLIIESLQKFHHYYGDDFRVECPTGSGQFLSLAEIASELSRRLTCIFLRDEAGRRPVYGGTEIFQVDPHWRDHILFYEYFHADNGAGIGASHQTGWTALVAKLIQQSGRSYAAQPVGENA